MPNSNCNFTFNHYKEILELAKYKGYKFFKCEDLDKIKDFEKVIVLRHDIDFSPKNATYFSDIEKNLGISSTYFIRLHATSYNPLELKTFNYIKKLKYNSHEIALHQEPDFAAMNDDETKDYLIREIQAFNLLFSVDIKGISTHEPARRGIQVNKGNIDDFSLKYESYFPEFTEDMKYISDSGARWREGCMCNWIKNNEKKLYINTHPFWWYKDTPLENY